MIPIETIKRMFKGAPFRMNETDPAISEQRPTVTLQINCTASKPEVDAIVSAMARRAGVSDRLRKKAR